MSYRLFNIQLLLIGCLAFSFAQDEGCAPTIRANAEYQPSTGISLGEWGAGYQGIEGYQLNSPFQINLEYQAGIDNSHIDTWNNLGEGTEYNWTDPEYYYLAISPDGGLPAWSYGDAPGDDMEADLQWAITGWGQTIFGGTIEEGRLVVTTGYRPFDINSHVIYCF